MAKPPKKEKTITAKEAETVIEQTEAQPTDVAKPVEAKFTKEDVEAAVRTATANYKPPKQAAAPTGADSIADAVAKAVAASLPAIIMGMEQAKQMSAHDIQLAAARKKAALEEKCHICGQAVGDGKGRGCGGPWKRDDKGQFVTDGTGARIEDRNAHHVEMAVFPNDPIAVQQWDGVFINGARYCSVGPNHKVWVPKVNNIAAVIVKFEEDQRIQQVGRKHIRQNGGSVGPRGQQVQAPTIPTFA